MDKLSFRVTDNNIQIQPMLRLNIRVHVDSEDKQLYSNTTNVKVKRKNLWLKSCHCTYSNTTNVKVKHTQSVQFRCWHLNSNTTNVKVKLKEKHWKTVACLNSNTTNVKVKHVFKRLYVNTIL